MQGAAPKGSYHNYCRSNRNVHSVQHTHRVRSIRTNSNKRNHQLQQFQDFQSYLKYLQNKERLQLQKTTRPKTTDYRSAFTSRPATQVMTRQNKINDQSKQKIEIVKPYFPFFKCRIDNSIRSEKMESQFRLKNHRFKLNYRIIEENMGKGELNDAVLQL